MTDIEAWIEVPLERYTPSAKRFEGTIAGLYGPGVMQTGIERSRRALVVLGVDVLAHIQSTVHPGHLPCTCGLPYRCWRVIVAIYLANILDYSSLVHIHTTYPAENRLLCFRGVVKGASRRVWDGRRIG